MKYSIAIAAAFLLAFFGIASVAIASVTPTITLSATGSGDNVQINVTGDPDANVTLAYTQPGSSSAEQSSLGTTDSNGVFSATVSSASYNLAAGMSVTAIVDGIASASVTWPVSILALSQNAIVINAGSSVTVNATNADISAGALYVSSNSSPSVADESINGNQITVEGTTPGSTTITVCEDYNSTACPTLYVMVEGENNSLLSFNLNNVSVSSGQSLPVAITGGDIGTYEIFKNTNPSAIQASISGSTLNLNAAAASGSSSIVVCTTDTTSCGVVAATVGSVSSSGISFSTSALTIPIDESTTVSIYGPSGETFYVSSNSNPAVVQANISGYAVTLDGLSAGASSVVICASTNNCASLLATVTTGSVASSAFSMSPSNVALAVGESANIALSGSGDYTLSSNTGPSIASVTISGSAATVYGISPGLTDVTLCESGNICGVLAVTVTNAGSQVTTTTTSTVTPASTTSTASTADTFTEYLSPGSEDSQVTELQNLLASLGFFSGTATGYYGSETEDAVLKFQAAHSINQLGVVGPATRAALNQIETNLSSTVSTTSTPISDMNLGQLQTEAQALQTELMQIESRISQLQ